MYRIVLCLMSVRSVRSMTTRNLVTFMYEMQTERKEGYRHSVRLSVRSHCYVAFDRINISYYHGIITH